MSPSDALARVAEVAATRGMDTASVNVAGRTAVVARRSDFKWRWSATRLHTFVVAAEFADSPPTVELDEFLVAARDHAIQHKGGLPRGLQTGTATIAVAVVANETPEVAAWAVKSHGRKFGAVTFPAVAVVSTGRTLAPDRLVVGGIYSSHLRTVLDDIVGTAIRGA